MSQRGQLIQLGRTARDGDAWLIGCGCRLRCAADRFEDPEADRVDRSCAVREHDDTNARVGDEADEAAEAAGAAVVPEHALSVAAKRQADPAEPLLEFAACRARLVRCPRRPCQWGLRHGELQVEELEQVVDGGAKPAGSRERVEVPVRNGASTAVVAVREAMFGLVSDLDRGIGEAKRRADAVAHQLA
jgi:hypothetical protein